MKLDLQEIERRIKYEFKVKRLLITALTHTSYGHENMVEHNERLEFLGDSVLDMAVSAISYDRFPQLREGYLTVVRSNLVNERSLATIARSLGLPELIRLGRGEVKNGGAHKDSLLADCLEALLGAVFLDGGYEAVLSTVEHVMGDQIREGVWDEDGKTKLQKISQAKWKIQPTYHVVDSFGPDHAKSFEVEVRVGDKLAARGVGTNKRDAEREAANACIRMATCQ